LVEKRRRKWGKVGRRKERSLGYFGMIVHNFTRRVRSPTPRQYYYQYSGERNGKSAIVDLAGDVSAANRKVLRGSARGGTRPGPHPLPPPYKIKLSSFSFPFLPAFSVTANAPSLTSSGSYEAKRHMLYDALYGSRNHDVNLVRKLEECVVVHNIVDAVKGVRWLCTSGKRGTRRGPHFPSASPSAPTPGLIDSLCSNSRS
jgi:hypothetical protein